MIQTGYWMGDQPIDGLESLIGDPLVGKVTMNAWGNGALHAILTEIDCNTILNTGVWTTCPQNIRRVGADKGNRIIQSIGLFVQ